MLRHPQVYQGMDRPMYNLAAVRQKYRTQPQQGGALTDPLLELGDAALIEQWHLLQENDWRADLRDWYRTLYREFVCGKKILDIGCGRGGDGIHFLRQGAHWTFADITETGLLVMRRVCRILGFSADFVLIDDDFAHLASLPMYDVIWCNTSFIEAPLEFARNECRAILPHLKPGGRWIECTSSPDFKAPGWEPYDIAKIRYRLFPARMNIVLDHSFHSGRLKWFDLVFSSDTPFDPSQRVYEVAICSDELAQEVQLHNDATLRSLGRYLEVTSPAQIASYAVSFPVACLLKKAKAGIVDNALIEIECQTTKGEVGMLLVGDDISSIIGEEQIATAQSPIITTFSISDRCRHIVFRNAADARSEFRIGGMRVIAS
jgi:SAM-dependent methyltransferase